MSRSLMLFSVFLFCLTWTNGFPGSSIKLLPDQDQEVSVKPFRIHHLLIHKGSLKPDTFYRLVVSFHGSDCIDVKCKFREFSNTSFETMEKLLEKDNKHRLLDHSLLEFWTDSKSEIPQKMNSEQRIDGETYYVVSMGVWRNCDSAIPKQKYADAKLVLELVSELKAKVDTAGGSYILNLNFGLWTILVLLIIFMTFGLLMWKTPGIRDVFQIPQKPNNTHKLD